MAWYANTLSKIVCAKAEVFESKVHSIFSFFVLVSLFLVVILSIPVTFWHFIRTQTQSASPFLSLFFLDRYCSLSCALSAIWTKIVT